MPIEAGAEQKQTTAENTATTPTPPAKEDTGAAIAAIEARALKAERALAERIASEKEAAKQHAEQLASQGQHETLIAQLKNQIAEYEPDAGLGRWFREEETKRIETVSKDMPPEWLDSLEAAESLKAKTKLIALYEKTKAQAQPAAVQTLTAPNTPSPRAPNPAQPAPSTKTVDVRAEMFAGKSLEELERKFPAEVRSFLSGQSRRRESPLASFDRRN